MSESRGNGDVRIETGAERALTLVMMFFFVNNKIKSTHS